jgi:hypothetical protein
MRNWLGLVAVAGLVAGTPAIAGESGWSRRGDDRPHVIFVPGEYGRSGRFVSWDDGYFVRGGGVSLEDGRARFHYDRSYPYEYRFLDEPAADEEEADDVAVPYCETRNVRDPKGGTSPVRICRN